ncbi:MAG: NADH-quinone oxidoreductase subunit N, partial [Anaerolineae bacterium]|nr:NADH-quinone oxidoreductase subunit N [Anaerolineae bacterium]
YAFTNIGAFAVVAAIEKDDATGTTMNDIKGLAFKRPWLAGAMAIFMFSLTGIPATAGFIGKVWVFRAALDAGLEPLAVLGVLTSSISAFYYVRVVWNMYFESGDTVVPERQQYLTGGLIIAAAGTLILGVLPYILEHLVRDATLVFLR